ncbi:hypothetical protein V502_09720 [Pseudogymnoascus sp. VKM F-4520 (FW-2644)]|nr:hypothetical protein V502_09720 [Pseudogymnoascus sp. VKM F-4520 (FW-2644)]
MWILRYVLTVLALSGAGQTAPGPVSPRNPALYPGTQTELLRREDTSTTADANSNQTAQNFWKLSKKTEDIEAFRKLHNLTLVESTPQDAAFMPSWPQALVQYLLINPPINCFSSSTHEINGQVVSSFNITLFNILQLLLSPFLFVAWVVAFGMTQASFKTGGWMSVLGWAMWFDLAQFYNVFAVVPLIFQYPASLALVVQRWHSDLGRVAYEVTNLNGCTPYQGLDYLQQGARFSQFRILQTVTFSISTLFGIMSLGNPSQMAPAMALPALAELIMTAIVATKGTPMVVSGNCLLVELNPNKGFLDSPISTRWKAFASFMGF